MAQLLSVFAASGAVPTAADLRSVAEDAWYGDDDLSFGPGAGRGGILTVRLPDARRAIAVGVETDPAKVAVMVDEQLDERDAVPPGVVEQLRRTRQVVSLEFDPDSFDDDGWELLDVLQSWLARELEGLVVVDDGIYDSGLHLLAPPSSGGLGPTPEVPAELARGAVVVIEEYRRRGFAI